MFDSKLLVLVIAMCISQSVLAKEKHRCIVCNGSTICSDTIPQECASNERQVVEDGVVKLQENNSAQKLSAKDKATEDARLKAKQYDDMLLNSYLNEGEIDLALSQALPHVGARVSSYTTLYKSAQENLAGLQQEYDKLTKQGHKIPKSLEDDIQDATARVAKKQKDLDTSVKELEAVKARYAAEKARYRELKGLATKEIPNSKPQDKY